VREVVEHGGQIEPAPADDLQICKVGPQSWLGAVVGFEQAVFDQDLGQRLLELAGLSLEFLDLVRGRLTRRVASQPLLACLQKLLRPTIIEVLVDTLLAAELGNTVAAIRRLLRNIRRLFL
jgi:hypothetical protein